MIFPEKVRAILAKSALYAVFCLFFLGCVCCLVSEGCEKGTAAAQAKQALFQARFANETNVYEGHEAQVKQAACVEAQQTYKALYYRATIYTMVTTVAAMMFLLLISVYPLAQHEASFSLLFLFIGLVGVFVYNFIAAFGEPIWGWLESPVLGHSVSLWLLWAGMAALTAVAAYADFFRFKRRAPAN